MNSHKHRNETRLISERPASASIRGGLGLRVFGFTLLELMLAVSIMGILAATAGVQYIRYVERARQTTAIVEIRGISAELAILRRGLGVPGQSLGAGLGKTIPGAIPIST